MKKILILILGLSLAGGIIFRLKVKTQNSKLPTTNLTPAPQTTQNLPPPTQNPSQNSFPSSFDLKVPFVSQAPFGVWDDLHNNACEEAAILLVHYYKRGQSLSKAKAEEEIKKMVDFQLKKYGKHKDLTAQETANLAKEFYGYKNARVKYNFTWDDIKGEIAKGNPVIVPAAGRMLKNPNFRQPGPIYHMLVIRGYTPTEIITNDVGTRKGEGYQYSYQILDKAILDWTGRKAILILDN